MFRVLASIVALALVAAGGWFGRVVPFAEQWPMFEALRTTAAIIFAVIGAWLAIIYPERLKLSFRAQSAPSEANLHGTGWGQLFTPVVNSTAILSVILFLGVVAPVVKRSGIPVDVEWLRGGSYALLVALTLWQLWTVLLTLIPADVVKTYLDTEDQRQRVAGSFGTPASSGAPPPTK